MGHGRRPPAMRPGLPLGVLVGPNGPGVRATHMSYWHHLPACNQRRFYHGGTRKNDRVHRAGKFWRFARSAILDLLGGLKLSSLFLCDKNVFGCTQAGAGRWAPDRRAKAGPQERGILVAKENPS